MNGITTSHHPTIPPSQASGTIAEKKGRKILRVRGQKESEQNRIFLGVMGLSDSTVTITK